MPKALIVEDHPIVSDSLTNLIHTSVPELKCYPVTTAHDGLAWLNGNKAAIILLDINLPDMSGLDLCKTVKQTHPEIKIIALSTFNQISYINKMTANGASGYLLKNITKEELVQAINTVRTGNTYHSFEVNEIIKTAKTKSENVPILTKRETDILKLVAEGYTNNQIGEKLFISTDTVDSHRKNLHTKLNVNNTALLVRYAIENNLV